VGTSDFLFYNKLLKNNPKTRRWWFMPVILATWEAEIRRIAVQMKSAQANCS
jgi:hypothetical protein